MFTFPGPLTSLIAASAFASVLDKYSSVIFCPLIKAHLDVIVVHQIYSLHFFTKTLGTWREGALWPQKQQAFWQYAALCLNVHSKSYCFSVEILFFVLTFDISRLSNDD